VNCFVVPSAMLGLGGVTAIDTSAAADTVKVTGVDVIPPMAAVMALAPTLTGVASPMEPAALLIVATDVAAEAQIT